MENTNNQKDTVQKPDTQGEMQAPSISPAKPREQVYVGTKIIRAIEMTSDEFKKSKGQEIGLEENARGYRVTYEDGYVSWSPKSVFERCYRLISSSEMRLMEERIKG